MNFCVWVLLRDGLRVHPFDRHDDGDKGLRAAGLTESNWRAWFEKTVRIAADVQESVRADTGALQPKKPDTVDLTELLYGDDLPTPDQIGGARQVFLARSSGGRWPRQDQVREELLKRWPQYMRHLKERDNREFESSMKTHRILQSLTSEEAEAFLERERRLWAELQQFRPLPPLYFFTVDYPFPVVETMRPASAVLGGVKAHEHSEDYAQLVLTAAKRLKETP